MIFMCMMFAQIYCIVCILREAKACAWSAQSKWIAWRACGVVFGVMVATVCCGWIVPEKDVFSSCIIIIALMSMTALLVFNLPSILHGMTDEKVGEELNLHKENTEI